MTGRGRLEPVSIEYLAENKDRILIIINYFNSIIEKTNIVNILRVEKIIVTRRKNIKPVVYLNIFESYYKKRKYWSRNKCS